MNENLIVEMEKKEAVTATFRKLEPSKKEAIYRAALKEFSSDVFDRVSLDLVAAAAGVSKGSLFQYFGNKEHLLEFVAEIFLDNYRQYWESYFAREHAVRARDRVSQYLLACLEYWERERIDYRFLMKMQYENPLAVAGAFLERVTQSQREYISTIIERGRATGEIRGDMETETISFLIHAALRNLEQTYAAILQTPKTKVDFRDIAAKITVLLFDGIAG
ncbi:MAG: TetR/AcrR family transcriptional regulator [candidate division Zixibacteria bacterium]|nr:TetR/AcrR family transcriptional regulator [candidate division Zixibacteria bacterium]